RALDAAGEVAPTRPGVIALLAALALRRQETPSFLAPGPRSAKGQAAIGEFRQLQRALTSTTNRRHQVPDIIPGPGSAKVPRPTVPDLDQGNLAAGDRQIDVLLLDLEAAIDRAACRCDDLLEAHPAFAPLQVPEIDVAALEHRLGEGEKDAALVGVVRRS